MGEAADFARLPDWEDRLNAFLAATGNRTFEWGRHDCMMFAAGVTRALSGIDPAAGHRDQYRGKVAAARHLKAMGHDRPDDLLDHLFVPVPPAMARRGDLVMHDGNVGVCMGAEALFVPLDGEGEGLARVPLSGWSTAWRIG